MRFLSRTNAPALSFEHQPGAGPLLVFCHGFMSDMAGAKALALEAWAQAQTPRRAFVRFDCSGHGHSKGAFQDGTISSWLQDLADIIDHCAPNGAPVVLLGSSMGGWLALLFARARPQQTKGLLLIAPAPDFTHWGLWQSLDEAAQVLLKHAGFITRPSAYGPEPYTITHALIQDGAQHCLLERPIAYSGPVRIVHGLADPDVPWQQSLTLAHALQGKAVHIHFIKDGDHRLSRHQDLACLCQELEALFIM
jgi:pimeloyl-ACP methyl ester carboxylesterase